MVESEMNIDKLNMDIMNITTKKTLSHFATTQEYYAYREGHRDARHAACEIVLEHNKASGSDGTAAAGADGQKPDAWLVPKLLTFEGARTSCPPELVPQLEGTVAWEAALFSDGDIDSVMDKHGVKHSPVPLFANNAIATQPPALTGQASGAPLADERAQIEESFNERFKNDSHVGWKPLDYWGGGWDACVRHIKQTASAVPFDLRSGEQVFELANSYFTWNADSWQKATQGTIGMPALLNYTRVAIDSNRAAPSPSAEKDSRDTARLDLLLNISGFHFEIIDQEFYLLDARGRIAGKGANKRAAIDAAIASNAEQEKK
jgi:hypothetical protein